MTHAVSYVGFEGRPREGYEHDRPDIILNRS
jgi:hypothetical protein